MGETHIVVDFVSLPVILGSFFLLSNAILLAVYFLYTENLFFHLSMNYLILTDSKKIINQFNGLHYWPTNSEIIESFLFSFLFCFEISILSLRKLSCSFVWSYLVRSMHLMWSYWKEYWFFMTNVSATWWIWRFLLMQVSFLISC